MKRAEEAVKKRDQPVHQYLVLGQTVKQQQTPTSIGMLALILLNLGFSIWGFYIFATETGTCERPLKDVILGCSVIFVISTVLTTCIYGLLRGIFFKVLATSQEIEEAHPNLATSSVNSFSQSTSAAVRRRDDASSTTVYQPLRSSEPDEENQKKGVGAVVERSNAEELARPITDRLTCMYCGFACLVCSFVAFAVYFFTALSWILVENNNCRTAVPSLYNQSKNFLIGLIIVFFLHALWFGLAFFYCSTLCQVYSIQQGIMSHLSKQHVQAQRKA